MDKELVDYWQKLIKKVEDLKPKFENEDILLDTYGRLCLEETLFMLEKDLNSIDYDIANRRIKEDIMDTIKRTGLSIEELDARKMMDESKLKEFAESGD